MSRAALALALVLGTATTAAADGIYFSEGIGGSNVKNELGQELRGAMRLRFAAGYRLTRSWAVEGWISADIGSGNVDAPARSGVAARCIDCGNDYGGDYYDDGLTTMTSAGVDVKYLRPLSKNLEVYLRGSLGKGWLDGDNYSGRGLGVGAGVQLKGKVPAIGFLFWPLFFTNWGPKVTAALYLDTGADFYRLHRNGDLDNPDSIDGSFNRITFGWAVGADF